MEWLNYHHLLYFWTVAREGTIARACEKLHLAQPTISGQLRALERALGAKLFEKAGRNLVLSETGRLVYRYADEIFSLGRELGDAVRGRPTGNRLRLVVGVTDALPKLIVHRLLEPALRLSGQARIICHDGKADQLLAQLALHELDLVISDVPASPAVKVRAFNHLLGSCGVSFFGTRELRSAYGRGFPRSLDGAPLLLPTENTALRRSLDQWFDKEGISPVVRGEFADSALLKVFGQSGEGIFVVPSAVEQEVSRQYRVRLLGRVESIREQFYAITVEKRIKNPTVVAICQAAWHDLFA